MSIQPPVLPRHIANITALTKEHIESARDHNEVVKVKKKKAEAPDFSGIEGHVEHKPLNFSGIPGHLDHGKDAEASTDEDKDAETDKESSKLDPAVVLYLPAKLLNAPAGAACGGCWKFMGDKNAKGNCVEVEGSIDGPTGVCGLYIAGDLLANADPQVSEGIVQITKAVSGYSEVGPTHCGSCEYYGGDQKSGSCEKVKGVVDFGGCCNRFEAK